MDPANRIQDETERVNSIANRKSDQAHNRNIFM